MMKETVLRKIKGKEVPYTLFKLTEAKTGCRVLDEKGRLVEVVHTETRPERKEDFKIRSVFDFSRCSLEDILIKAAETVLIRDYRRDSVVTAAKSLEQIQGLPEDLDVQELWDRQPDGGRGRTAKTPTQRADDALAKMDARMLQSWMIANGFYNRKNFQAVAETKGITIPEDFNY